MTRHRLSGFHRIGAGLVAVLALGAAAAFWLPRADADGPARQTAQLPGPSGSLIFPDGTWVLSDGTYILPDGTVAFNADPTAVKLDSGGFSNLPNTFDNNTGTNNAVSLTAATFLYVGYSARFHDINVDLGGVINAAAATLSVAVSNGSGGYLSATLGSDGTASGGATLAQDGVIRFTIPSGWLPQTVDTVSAYWARLTVSATLTAGVQIQELNLPDVRRAFPNGSAVLADGTFLHPGGAVLFPNQSFMLLGGDGGAASTAQYIGSGLWLRSNGIVTFQKGLTIRLADGTLLLGGTGTSADPFMIQTDGTVILRDGTVIYPSRTAIQTNGTVTAPSGALVTLSNGARIAPNGTIITGAGAGDRLVFVKTGSEISGLIFSDRTWLTIGGGSHPFLDNSILAPSGAPVVFESHSLAASASLTLADGSVVSAAGSWAP